MKNKYFKTIVERKNRQSDVINTLAFCWNRLYDATEKLENVLRDCYCASTGEGFNVKWFLKSNGENIHPINDLDDLLQERQKDKDFLDFYNQKIKESNEYESFYVGEFNIEGIMIKLKSLYRMSEKIGILLEYEHQKSKEKKNDF